MTRHVAFKILIAGDAAVGKTSLLIRYIDGRFNMDLKATIGVNFLLKELKFDEFDVKLQLWDMGGQKQFRKMMEKYTQGSTAAILMFDLTRQITLDSIEDWVNILRREDPDLPIALVGGKSDLQSAVNESYVLELKDHYDFFYYLKTSAKSGENVEELFEILAVKLLKDKVLMKKESLNT